MTRNISTALKNHYAQGTTTLALCWKATLQDGTIVAATTHSEPLEISGVTYEPTQGYNPSDVENASDLTVDNLEIEGVLMAPSITADDLASGRWDYAQVEIFEVNRDSLADGVNLIRRGRLGQVRAGRTMFNAELRGMSQAYSRRIVELVSLECRADLGDARCGVDLEAWTVTGTVASVTDNRVITDPARTEPANWFTGGLLTFTSGLNEGLSMEVKSSGAGVLELFEAMPFRVAAADDEVVPGPVQPDTYTVYAGCQKRFYEDCIGKFDNALNFRGEPHLPGVGIYSGPGFDMTTYMTRRSVLASPPPPGSAPPPGPPAGSPDTPGSSGGVVAQPSGSLSLADYGAAPDGTTNNLAAINSAIAAASAAGVPLYVPPGTWAWSGDVIHLDSVTLTGAGPTSILYALDYLNSSIWMEGTGPEVKNLKLAGAAAPSRQAAWESTKIAVMGATGFVISNNLIEGAPAASIQTANDAGGGTIEHNTIRNSLADSIHLTDGAHDITVNANQIEYSGDDGIACVSYDSDAGTVNNITASNNRVLNNVWGRNMSVVGGSDILYTNNYVEGNDAGFAGLYIAQESGDFDTQACQGIKAELNTIKNCGSVATGHAGIMMFSDGAHTNDDLWLLRNDIIQTGNAGVNGIRLYGPQTNVKLDQNRYTGTGSAVVDGGGGTVITVNTTYSTGAIGYSAPTTPAPPPAPGTSPPPSSGSWGTSAAGIVLRDPSFPGFVYLATGGGNAYWVDDNPWGSEGLSRGTFAGDGGYTYETAYGRWETVGPNGEGGGRWAWKWPSTTLGSHEVKGYPALVYGAKPGMQSDSEKPGGIAPILQLDGTFSTASPSGITPGSILPARFDSLPAIHASWNYTHNVTPSGQGHLSFDILCTDKQAQERIFAAPPITHEIMIPLNYWGDYGSHGHRGQPYITDVTLEGYLWHVYYSPFFAGGWKFIVFEPDGPFTVAQAGSLNLTTFFNWIRTRPGWTNGNEWLASIELGIEPIYGIGDIEVIDWRVWTP